MGITQKLETLTKMIQDCDDLLSALDSPPPDPGHWMSEEEINEIDFSFYTPTTAAATDSAETPIIRQQPEYTDTEISQPAPEGLTPLEIRVLNSRPPGSIQPVGIKKATTDQDPLTEARLTKDEQDHRLRDHNEGSQSQGTKSGNTFGPSGDHSQGSPSVDGSPSVSVSGDHLRVRFRLLQGILKEFPHVTPSFRCILFAIPPSGATVDKLVGLTGYSKGTVRKVLGQLRKTGHVSFKPNYLAGSKYNCWYVVDQ